ncbi:MAG: BofC C-terminal domain-containing protein [Eggerthellaceae bacterium]|nr:BofC C-terminal domain-containing protein [Eggerthellaceae bacterium]
MARKKQSNTLGPYELRGELGRGAMAKVWRAWDPKLEREVAIKEPLFDERLSGDILEEMGSRFVKEGKAAARLNHPGIVTIYAADVYDSRPVIVMELIDGITLSEMLDSTSMTPQSVLDALDQLLDAVGYAHSQGVVHRDIKPDNIFVTSDGRIKLSDFGIAHVDDSSMTRATQLGTVLGTPGYMAPEQATGSTVDNRTDLFAIGTIAYEMLTGKNPFGAEDGSSSTTLLYRIVHEPAPDLPDVATKGLPKDIRPGVLAALNKNPDDRPQDADAFKAMLHGSPTPEANSSSAFVPAFASASKPFMAQDSTKTKTGASSAQNKKWLPYVLVGGIGIAILVAAFVFASSGNGRNDNLLPGPNPGPVVPEPAEEGNFYLTILGGKLALYQGTPEGSSTLERITDVQTSALSSETLSKLEKGIVVADIETAEDLIETCRQEATGGSGGGSSSGGSSSNSKQAQPKLKTYYNSRYGYSVSVPDDFVFGREADNGDGLVMTNNKLEMTVTVYGSNNIFDYTAKQLHAETLWGHEGWYNTCTDDMYVVTYLENGMVYYVMGRVGEGSINNLILSYPESRKSTNDAILDKIVFSFQAGDLTRGH